MDVNGLGKMVEINGCKWVRKDGGDILDAKRGGRPAKPTQTQNEK